jgi:hypothetical protein
MTTWPHGREAWHGLPPLGWVGWPFTLFGFPDFHGPTHPWYRGHLVAHTAMGAFFCLAAWVDHPIWWAVAVIGALWEGVQEHLPSPGQPSWQHVWDFAFYMLGAGLMWWALP